MEPADGDSGPVGFGAKVFASGRLYAVVVTGIPFNQKLSRLLTRCLRGSPSDSKNRTSSSMTSSSDQDAEPES